MTNEIQNLLIPLAHGQNLTHEQAVRAFQIIMHGGATPAQMGAFLMGLRQKGETVDELVAGAEVMRHKATRLTAPPGAIDTCGTGGDAKGTLNVSTAAAIVVAACGVPVAKHGNRSVTSASGSADVLQALGVNIAAEVPVLERALAECGLCFMMAPKFHQATRHIAPVRVELGLRTIFNLLGPLTNPAGAAFQLLGVWDNKWLQPMAEALSRLGTQRAWVVCGADGLDEISLHGPTEVVEVQNGTFSRFTLEPADFGLEPQPLEAIQGQDPAYNAEKLANILDGEAGPYRDIVLMNSAAALLVAGVVETLAEGMARAAEAVASGKARATLANLARITSATA